MQTLLSSSCRAAVLACALAPLVARAEDAAAAPSLSGELVSLLLPLALVVATLFAAYWLLRRRLGLDVRDGPLRVSQVVAVGPRERLVLIELDGRRLLVGVTSARITRLAVFNQRDAPIERSDVSSGM